MAGITFSGVASGIDTGSIVTQLVAAESVPITALQTQQSQVDAASQTISAFSTKLATLRTAAAALSDPVGFASTTATSSDPSIVASASGAAAPGAYTLTVSALAQEQRTYATPQASATDALNMDGTLSIQVGSATAVPITVAAGDSLSTIAANITASGARVSATVIYDGSNYRLQVRGLDTGATNAITFGESGFDLGLSAPANTVQSAQDASMKLDGITITRPTNQVVGVVPGVTLALTKITTSPVNVTVASDPSSISAKITTLVAAYNAVVTAGHTAAGYGGTAASNPVLSGDSTIRSSLSRLQSILTGAVPGASSNLPSLSSVGISSTHAGQLAFDSTKFAAALLKDPTSVAKLFTTNTATSATGAMGTLAKMIDTLSTAATSPILTHIAALQKQSKSLATQATAMQARVDAYQTQLKAEFAAMEAAFSKSTSQKAALPTTPTNGG